MSQETRDMLEAEIGVEEIKLAVSSCGSDKAPGPDGFTFKFFKTYWDLVKDDIVEFVKYFETLGKFSNGCNSSFISLAAKVKDPLSLKDYRPINLIGALYKIIAKILANRMRKHIGGCINEVQSAFLEGRNILEGPLIVNELVSWTQKTGRKMLLFKADFNKAFDSVNWEYLDSIMMQMNFSEKWRRWIAGCLESSKASVLVNGSPTKDFDMSKGVRQGDPMSPFLFIIAMEGLHVMMSSAVERGLFDGMKIPNSNVNISHLFYADDALFIGHWSQRNIANLARILRCFHMVSGLKVNFNKSRVYSIGGEPSEVSEWASPLGCEPSALPFTYLGVPVGDNMNRKNAWNPIIDKFKSKLSTWKSKTLSFGGRVTLAKAVLGNLPTYYLSLFAAPIGVIKDLEKIQRQFIWGGMENKSSILELTREKRIGRRIVPKLNYSNRIQGQNK
uniref:Reverse transcriptase domain-containing protein n=1 Tax=Lactuca sativa TaxID=4236 RepID=A0A9R1W018_LACSA|nr:hypothetical protein LSAT_V11C400160070 [Lactuca sativa]